MERINSFRNQRNFPPFLQCPENPLSSVFYEYNSDILGPDYNATTLGQKRHWCLLGEITHVMQIGRIRVEVRDRTGQVFPVAFYLDTGPPLDVRTFKVGYTIAVLYAKRHQFLDGTIGVREEELDNFKVTAIPFIFRLSCRASEHALMFVEQVFPSSLERFLETNERLCDYKAKLEVAPEEKCCHACGKTEAVNNRCSKCSRYWYCDAVSIPKYIV